MFILKINNEPVTDKSVVSLGSTDSVEVVGGPAIKLSLKDTRSYEDWYSSFVYSKQQAMLHGGKGTEYEFTKPLTSLAVKTINNVEPDNLGNITLLGSKTVDVSIPAGGKNSSVVIVSRLSAGVNRVEALKEIYLFTMRLYHAFNHCTSRLLEFDPATWGDEKFQIANKLGKFRGALLNYQANVARWNYLVWKSSYKQDVEVSRQNIALSLGYSCVPCQVDSVVITTTITKKEAQPTNINGLDSVSFFTIYRQSVSDDRKGKDAEGAASPTTKITKDEVEIFGFGQDAEYKNWDTITIVQTLPSMVQSDKYSELFALAPGTGITEYIYLDKETSPEARMNEFEITTTWEVKIGEQSMEMSKTVTKKVAAMNAKSLTEDNGVAGK